MRPTTDPAAANPHAAAEPVSASPRGAAGTPSPVRAPRPAGEGTSNSPRRERAAQGIPGPATGEADPAAGNRLPASPVRARVQAPAGASGHDSPPAGSTGKTYMVILPAGLKMLNLNDRLHWAEERRRARDIKKAAWAVALCDKLPRLGRVSVTAEYQPPDRRHRDGDNIAISAKNALDGIVAAGCLPGDDRRYVTGTFCTIGEPYPKGRLILHLTEVAAAAESDGAA